MTVSNDAFDLIFSRRNKLEARIDKTEYKIARIQSKIDALESKDVSLNQQRKLGKFKGILQERNSTLDVLNSDLEEINDVQLPMDELNIIYDPLTSPSTFGVSFQESPYDDLINAGDYIKVGTRGTRSNGSLWTSQLSLNHPDYTGDKCVLGNSTFEYSGLKLNDFSGYETAEIYVQVNGVDVQTFSII